MFPEAEISWLTNYPEAIPVHYVDNILEADFKNATWLMANYFDWLINIDKDKFAISLAKLIKARKKTGFIPDKFGKCVPTADKKGVEKWLSGINDELSKINRKSYPEEVFAMCGFDFNNEEYIVECEPQNINKWAIDFNRKVIGLNTGSGPLWKARRWPDEYWIELAKRLKSEGYEIVLLGGEQEDDSNKKIARLSGAKYFGFFNLKEFTELVNQCELVVTCVTMCLHLAIGLKKKVILLNSTFNKNEFYLYNRGIILEPDIKCNCYYADECPNECMKSLSVDKVYKNVRLFINK
jgi:heptosyltransferase-2